MQACSFVAGKSGSVSGGKIIRNSWKGNQMPLLRDSPRWVSLTGLSDTVRTCTFLSVGLAGGIAHSVGNNEDPGMRCFGRCVTSSWMLTSVLWSVVPVALSWVGSFQLLLYIEELYRAHCPGNRAEHLNEHLWEGDQGSVSVVPGIPACSRAWESHSWKMFTRYMIWFVHLWYYKIVAYFCFSS